MGSTAKKVKTKGPPTLRKSASQVEMSSVLFSLFSSSSGGGGSSCRNIHSQKILTTQVFLTLWYVAQVMTFFKMLAFTFGRGTTSSSYVSTFNSILVSIPFNSIESTKIAYIVVHAKILQHGLDSHRLLCNLKQFDMCCRFSADV